MLIESFLSLACLSSQVAASNPPEFPVFVWRIESPGAAIPKALVQAFGGVNVEGADEAKWAREHGVAFFVGHGPGRDALHIDTDRPWYTALWQRYWDTRDATDLVRIPCLSEPQTREDLRKTLARTLAARDGDHGFGISLGDEVGLTPYGSPLDLCTSQACRASFEEFVRTSETWGFLVPTDDSPIPYPDTDTTRLAWLENDSSLVGAWLARRAFHHEVVAEVLIELAAQVSAGPPRVPVGLFGQSGRSAFADVGVEQVFDHLDFMEVYRLLDSRELLYTRRRAEQKSYLTLFQEEDAPHAPAHLAYEHWMRGGDGLVLWSDRDLVERTGFAERMTNVVGNLRTLRHLWPEWQPRPSTVAILHSPDSLALSWLRDALHDGPTWMRRFPPYHNERGTREVSLRAVLRALEDCGELPGAIPIEELDAATGDQFPLVIANQLILVDKADERLLRKHLAAGNNFLVIGPFAVYDRRGQRRGDDLYATLAKEFPDQIQRLTLDGKRYLAERSNPRRSYIQSVLKSLREQLSQRVRPRWELRSTQPLYRSPNFPWLTASQISSNGTAWLCATLPNATSESDRRALRDLAVQFECDPGWSVTWLHPPAATVQETGSFVLPAGEPAIFELRKSPPADEPAGR